VAHVVEIPLPFQPRRSRLAVLGGLIVLGTLALVMVGAAFLLTKGGDAHHAAASTPAIHLSKGQVGPTSAAGKPTLSRAQTTVLILNGNGINGAAGAAASVLHHFRYRVRSVGNAPRMDYPRSLVMFRPGMRAEALRFGHDLGVKLVGPLDGLRIGAIHGAKLVYVLGR
jgi:LytR cell envelope-related transcriptional attenuator